MKRLVLIFALIASVYSTLAQRSHHDYIRISMGPSLSVIDHEVTLSNYKDVIYELDGSATSIQYGHVLTDNLSWIVSMTHNQGIITNDYVMNADFYKIANYYKNISMTSGIAYSLRFGKRSSFSIAPQLGLLGFGLERLYTNYRGSEIAQELLWFPGFEASVELRYNVAVTEKLSLGVFGSVVYDQTFPNDRVRSLSGSFGVAAAILL